MWELDSLAKSLPHSRIISFIRAGKPTVYRSGGGSHRTWMQINGWSIADSVELYFENQVLRSAHTVIVNSEMARKDLIRDTNITKKKVRLLRNPIDLQRFIPESRHNLSGDPSLCFVGSDFARKGLDIAIRCLPLFSTAQLFVLGSGKSHRYRILAEHLGVGDRVHFMGSVASEEYLPAADICILPTRYDSAANVIGEALACGIPAITTTRNGAHEILPDSQLIIDQPQDLVEWKSAIEWVMSYREWKDRCRTVAERYNGEKIYEQFWEMAKNPTAMH